MPNAKTNLLIVDDDSIIRMTISAVLAESGYGVRSAEDGFSALVELRKDVPDIVLSDLNMAGMSGFEFLSVIRRRFPTIRTIAMSGAYSGSEVPAGVAAAAFYEKGSSLGVLLRIVEAMSRPEPSQLLHHDGASAPIWVPPNGHDPSGKPYVMITCLECLRTFPQVLGEAIAPIREAGCVYCHSLIHFAIVQPAMAVPPQVFERERSTATPTPLDLLDCN